MMPRGHPEFPVLDGSIQLHPNEPDLHVAILEIGQGRFGRPILPFEIIGQRIEVATRNEVDHAPATPRGHPG
jgi:hypothetical protein